MLHPSEHHEQVCLFHWADLNKNKYPELEMLFAIPNGSNKTITQALKFKREGLRKGFPDVGLLAPKQGFYGLFIELKRKGGKPSDVSKEQKEWLDRLVKRGYLAVVCYGADEAIKVIEGYVRGQAQD